MKIRKGFIFAALFLLTSCAMQPQQLTKITGSPEVVINTDDFDHVRYEIITEMKAVGFLLEDESKHRVCFVKELLDIGSSKHESVKAEIVYSLLPVKKGINVALVSSIIRSYDSQSIFLKQEDMTDNGNWFRYFHKILQNVKTSIESD